MANASATAIVRSRLEELPLRLRGRVLALRMWHEVMTERDRRALYQEVKSAPRKPEVDDNLDPRLDKYPLKQELLEGSPGKLLHRCYYRWGVVGMWMKARKVPQPRAIIELAYELNLLSEADHRRLLAAVGEKESTPATQRPSWDHGTGKLHYGGKLARQVQNPGRATNIVAILDAFEEQGWPARIDDPLPDGGDKQRLREAIRTLNQGLSRLRFRADGTGSGICWEPADTRATPAHLP